MQEEPVQLEYDENAPPPHRLELKDHQPNYQLHEVAGKKLPSEGLVLRYDPQNQYIGIGCKNGCRIIYSVEERIDLHYADKIVNRYNCLNENSVTTLKWRPLINTTNKVLVTADSEGTLEYWHIPSMKKLFFLREDNNTINTIDFSRNGTSFGTAGKDANIRIYDQQTKSVTQTLKKADWNHIGHDNRIFAIKFLDQNTIVSGGWDSVIHVWDIRSGKSVKHFYGANISGESLDIQDGKVLTGCYSAQNQIKVWSLNKGTLLQTIDWTHNIDQAAYVYAASFSPYDIGMMAAGSTGKDASVRLFKDLNNKGEHVLMNEVLGVNESCFSLDFSHKQSQLAFTTAHHGFYVYDQKKVK